MEEQKMNEKESLELIAQMIRVTKQSIGSGSGNKFLMYGYTAAILSIVIYALVYFTGNSAWSAGWFLMFLPFLVSSVREKRNRPKVVTYDQRNMESHRSIVCTYCLDDDRIGVCYRSCQFRVDDAVGFVVLWYGYVDYRSGYQGIQPYLFPVARACHGYLYVYDYAFFTYAYGVAALFRGIVCRRDDCSGTYS